MGLIEFGNGCKMLPKFEKYINELIKEMKGVMNSLEILPYKGGQDGVFAEALIDSNGKEWIGASIYVPDIMEIRDLFIFTHEAGHVIHKHDKCIDYLNCETADERIMLRRQREEEADLFAINKFQQWGIEIPFGVLPFEFHQKHVKYTIPSFEPDEFLPVSEPIQRAATYDILYDKIPNDKKYMLFRDIWAEIEDTKPLLKRKIISDVFKHRPLSIINDTKEQLKEYTDSNGMVTIYRGNTDKSPKNAISWTVKLETAQWFADRFPMYNGKVIKGIIHIDDIMDYITDRNEYEVLVNYKKVIKAG